MAKSGQLPFEYVVDDGSMRVTSFGGLPVVAETLAAFGVTDGIRGAAKPRTRREFDYADIASAVVLTMAAGGDCIDDSRRLRDDDALQDLLGAALPAPETIRQTLYEFHEDRLVEEAAERAKNAGLASYVPEESEPLKALSAGNAALIQHAQRRYPAVEATLDIDATIAESHKKEAKPHYQDGRGYQPVLAVWVEQDLIVSDEFRDGNVPAHQNAVELTKRAFAALPSGVKVRRCRGDSQLYNMELLRWMHTERIEFTVGAQLRAPLRDALQKLPAAAWQHVQTREDTQVDAAFADYLPRDLSDVQGIRFVAIRMTPRQKDLLEDDGRHVVYLAIVTNRRGSPAELLRWYWGKAGTIEHVHDVVKNELGGGVLPCGRFGANAAWFRLSALTYNVLSVIRRLGPAELSTARPKRLRLHLFTIPAVLSTHARKLFARLSSGLTFAMALLRLRANVFVQPTPA